MDFQKIAIKCLDLNKKYGYLHTTFVAVFMLSVVAIYFFLVNPIFSFIFPAPLAGFVSFAILFIPAIYGIELIKQRHLDGIIEWVYQQSKIDLTLGILMSFAILGLKPLFLKKLHGNGE